MKRATPAINRETAMTGHDQPRGRLLALMALLLAFLGAVPAAAQMPASFYWKSLAGANAIPLLVESMSGNTNPFDPALIVDPDGNFDATIAIAGYARTFVLFDGSAMVAFIAPMGRVSGEVALGGLSFDQAASGFGDPMIEFNINLVGPRAQKTIPDALRYEPGFSLDFLADLALPIGAYNPDQSLNIGQNRWYGRFALPMILQLGPWVPGRRTTVELLPSVWVFGANTDYLGQTLETDPMFQLDGHVTRDITERLWAAFDLAYYNGGGSSIDGLSGDNALNNFGLGFTLGYHINDNLSLTFGYKTTVNDKAPTDLRFDNLMFTLVYGWHPVIEGARRLQEAE
jgi:hypothetical protein